jgi:hypothetical protein
MTCANLEKSVFARAGAIHGPANLFEGKAAGRYGAFFFAQAFLLLTHRTVRNYSRTHAGHLTAVLFAFAIGRWNRHAAGCAVWDCRVSGSRLEKTYLAEAAMLRPLPLTHFAPC